MSETNELKSYTRSSIVIALVTITAFLVGVLGKKVLGPQWGLEPTEVDTISGVIFGLYPWFWVPPFLAALLLFAPRDVLRSLGLQSNLLLGLGVGFLITLPLLLYYGVTSEPNPAAATPFIVMRYSVVPAITEELLFRALMFGFLFRFCRWGFLPAALLSALIFGAAHLYQSSSFLGALGVFAITAFGAVWFSWLYTEWRYNLWVPITVHLLMNFYWGWFSIASNAGGNVEANVFRVGITLFSIVLTVLYARRHGGLIIKGARWLYPGKSKKSVSG